MYWIMQLFILVKELQDHQECQAGQDQQGHEGSLEQLDQQDHLALQANGESQLWWLFSIEMMIYLQIHGK